MSFWQISGAVVVEYVALGAMAFLVSMLAVPTIIRWAPHTGLLDAPDGHRKLQHRAIPLGGGIAIALALCITIACALGLGGVVGHELLAHWRFLVGFSGALALICGVGLIDDLWEVRGRQKLFAQFVAVGVIVCAGLTVQEISILGWKCELGLLAIPFTMVWLVGAINALNLIDGLDGLAGTVSVVLSGTLGVLAAASGRPAEAAFCWALLGGTLGFLIYNWSPAKIYLGDAGSLMIGLALGVLAMRIAMKGAATLGLTVPVVIWAVLFFDVAMAMLRRRLTGQSVYASDRAHLHHVLQRRGFSVPGVVCIIGLLCLLCCVGVLAGTWLNSDLLPCVVAAAVLSSLVISGLFGTSEVRLFGQRIWNFLQSLIQFSQPHREQNPPIASRFQGVRAWDDLWAELIQYSERFDVFAVQLNVSAPVLGEEYHAQWDRRALPDARSMWRLEAPLLVGSLAVGRLTLSGRLTEGGSIDGMTDLICGLKPFQVQMEAMLQPESKAEHRKLRGLHRQDVASGPRLPHTRLQRRDRLPGAAIDQALVDTVPVTPTLNLPDDSAAAEQTDYAKAEAPIVPVRFE